MMKAIALVLILPTLCIPVQDPDFETLIKRLGDDSIEVREKAAAALVALGNKVEEKLKARLESAQGILKSQIESVLQSIRRGRKLQTVLPPVKRITLEAKDKPWNEVALDFQRLASETGQRASEPHRPCARTFSRKLRLSRNCVPSCSTTSQSPCERG